MLLLRIALLTLWEAHGGTTQRTPHAPGSCGLAVRTGGSCFETCCDFVARCTRLEHDMHSEVAKQMNMECGAAPQLTATAQ